MVKALKARVQETSARRSEVERKYRERHPAQAAQLRALRKEQAQLRKDWGHKRGGTPETLQKASKVQQGSLARLFTAGSIDAHQLAYASEIRSVAERIGQDVAIGTASLETRVDVSRHFGNTFFEKLGAVRAEVAYTAWRSALRRPGPVLAMIVEDCGCREVERQFGMRSGSAKALLLTALDAWPGYRADARREVDEASLLAAQAGLL